MFENFQDRGEQFAACVKTYTDAARVQQAGS
jgi:UDP-N-acetylmuramoylalanine-D-glutamate ligase